MPIEPSVVRELRGVVGDRQVLLDDDVTHRYRTDWTRRFQASSAVVVRPGDAQEVAEVVRICTRREVAIVPQGGNTGLVAGGVPLQGELVVSSERLLTDPGVTASGDLVVGAGTTLADVQRAATARGRLYAIDIASRDSATIGGTIATNAGGLRVLRYGDTRRQVSGIEIVTGTGEILSSMRAALRDNTGYHLPSLVVGSEGTLGIVTAGRLRVVQRPHARASALIGFKTVRQGANAAERLRSYVPPVEAVEIFLRSGLELVSRAFGLNAPLASGPPCYVLLDVAGDEATADEMLQIIDDLDGVDDVAVGVDSQSRARLWQYRELHTDAIATVGVPHKLDIAVPPGSLCDFMDRVPEVVREIAPQATTWLFGHGGESSIHVNVTGLAEDDFRVDEAVLQLVASFGGSISAEHGIGRAKLPWLPLSKSASELRIDSRVKSAFDPLGIMNPGVLVSV